MTSEELEKVRTEARILARCKHNNIIRYKDHFMMQPPLTMCLVMEYADGGLYINFQIILLYPGFRSMLIRTNV